MAKFERFYDPEVLARIGRLELRARMVVEGIITGLHRSPYHGTAVEFADHRAYVAGDDLRHIDWKVYGRLGRFVIKKFEEETNLRAHILLDCSESMRFSHGGRMSKYDYGGTLAASLAYLLNRQLDSVGLTLFDSKIRQRIPPSTGKNVLNLIGEIMEETEPAEKTGLDEVFSELAEELPRRGMVIVISDLFAPREDLATALQAFGIRGHDTIVFHVLDETELSFPFEGNTLFDGLEDYPEVSADPRQLREAYISIFGEYLEEVERVVSTAGVDYQRTLTSDPLDAAVISLIAARARMRRIRR